MRPAVGVRAAVGLLAVTSGALDVASFLRLGDVSTSVMTSNLVLLAVSAVRHDAALAEHCATALAGFVVGVAVSVPVVDRPDLGVSSGTRRLRILLASEAGLLAAVAIGWAVTGGRPTAAPQYLILAAVTVVMGSQSVATRHLGGLGIATTYFTGMLTGVVRSLARHGPTGVAPVAALALGALVVGAASSVLLIELAPRAVMVLPLAAVTLTAVLAVRRVGDEAHRG